MMNGIELEMFERQFSGNRNEIHFGHILQLVQSHREAHAEIRKLKVEVKNLTVEPIPYGRGGYDGTSGELHGKESK